MIKKLGFGWAAMFAAFVGSSAAAPAHATVIVTNVQLAGPAAATGPTQIGGYYTGFVNGEHVYDDALILTIGGNLVFVNCDDLFHEISLGQQQTLLTITPFSSMTSAPDFNGGSYDSSQISQMSWLLDVGASIWKANANSADSSVQYTEQLDFAALQLASWEVGNLSVAFTGFDPTVVATATDYITQSKNQTGAPGYSVEQLSGSVQAQLFDPRITPVPEPLTVSLFGAGIVGIVTIRKRKCNKVG